MEDHPATHVPSRRPLKRGILILVAALLSIGALVVTKPFSHGAVSIQYLSRYDQPGSTYLRFAVTNIGPSVVFPPGLFVMEVEGMTNQFRLGAKMPKERLQPGKGLIAECLLSDKVAAGLKGRWRMRCYFGDNTLRSWISWWQWRPGGPGASANWMIPRFLKGMPATVIGSTDWNEPAPPSEPPSSPGGNPP
jgi:hypothetical protein